MNEKKDNIIRPLDSSFKLLILIFSISSIVFIFSLIWGIINDKYIDNLANLIAGFIVTSISTVSTLIILLYYFSYKIKVYSDRFEKYNIINRKKVYYYKDLTVKENKTKIQYSFYKNNKKILKLRVVENGEKLIGSYYRFIKKNSKQNI